MSKITPLQYMLDCSVYCSSLTLDVIKLTEFAYAAIHLRRAFTYGFLTDTSTTVHARAFCEIKQNYL